ncbi:protein of unknown function [Methylocella tundrae]|uniref:Uncharacterized protein n=1 Tax=Methylocella tundrae TaxID=227605 RepID=A0A4U8YXM8_METTU|nr:protein of unknown function [Methylocella tundrae]
MILSYAKWRQPRRAQSYIFLRQLPAMSRHLSTYQFQVSSGTNRRDCSVPGSRFLNRPRSAPASISGG